MNNLLELLGKYNCDLSRGNISMKDFLEDNFKRYICDLEQSLLHRENTLIGYETYNMISQKMEEIKSNKNKIIKVFDLYNNGQIILASQQAFEIFEKMKPQFLIRGSIGPLIQEYFRIRTWEAKEEVEIERKELFHIPLSKNYLVGPERYSMPGHPCLYLSSQRKLCWYECKKPSKFAIAKFYIPQDEEQYFNFIDFSYSLKILAKNFESYFCNEPNNEELGKVLFKHIYLYPLRASCSVSVEHPDGKFKEEYIMSQLLLQWIAIDNKIDGIKYETCKRFGEKEDNEEIKKLNAHNLVLVTKDYDIDGYDKKLRKYILVSKPKLATSNNNIDNIDLEDYKKF